MAVIVVYDEGASPEAVLEVHPSANTPDYSGRTDVVVNPDLSGVAAVLRKYWKHVTGSIVEMTQGEKNAVDAAEVAAADESDRLTARDLITTRGIKHLLLHIHDRINTNAAPADRLTVQEALDDINARIDAG